MKSFILPILTGIIVLLIGIYINREKVDVRYILSESIPTAYNNENNSNKNIQQLQIKNNGEVLVKKIVIKIDKQVDNYKVIPYSSVDSFHVSKKAGLEINYPELPPNGSIKIILETKESAISDNDIEINDDKGIVTQALSKDQNIDYLKLFTLLVYLISILYSGFQIYRNNISSNVNNSPFEKILKKGKPFLLSETSWEKVRKEAIENLFRGENYFSSHENSKFYEVLTEKKPIKVNDNEWQKILAKAQEKFGIVIKQECVAYTFTFNNNLLSLKRPINFDVKEWNKVIDAIGKYFCLYKKDDLKYAKIIDLHQFLIGERPMVMTESIWDKLREDIETFLFYKLVDEIIGKRDLSEYLSNLKFEFFNKDRNKRFIEFTNNVIIYNQSKAYYDELKWIVQGVDLKNIKPVELDINDWNELKALEYQIKAIKEKASEKFNDSFKIQNDLGPLKERITKQLEIIDAVLTDPDFINKIESYNNVFNSGNFENLRRLAFLNNREINNNNFELK